MSEITKTVEIMECDYHRMLPPKLILEHTLSAILVEMRAAGGSRERLFAACGAVWMLSHMRFYLSAPIYPGYVLRFRVHPRVVEGGRYIFKAEVFRGDVLLVDFDCSLVPVSQAARHVVRLSAVEPIWTAPPRTAESKQLHRLRSVCEFTPCGEDIVRMSDCDCNHHMTSGAYLSLACNALNFWDGTPERYMKMMQLDYASEVLPGTLLRFERGAADGAQFVRGRKPDGTVAFTAQCVFD